MKLALNLAVIFVILSSGCSTQQEKTPVVLSSSGEEICFALYTVHNKVLKLTAQLYQIENQAKLEQKVTLDIFENRKQKKVAESNILMPGYTANFHVTDWDMTHDIKYRVSFDTSFYEGLIRKDPKEKDIIVAAAFTGNSPGPGRGDISKQDVVDNVAKVDPDILIFTGDQVYNHNFHTEHWIKFGDDFGELIRRRPTITIPDDHDVGHPNLWGANGVACMQDWEGGYMKSAEYVNMVQRQQTSHLPDPYDPTPIEQGISVYYTSLNLGGIDFAIIEDRKFKSGCKGIITKDLGPRPDHVTISDYDPKSFDIPGKKLLGERQLKFLEAWSQEWDNTIMKTVVSQTLFSMASTYHSGNKMFYYADFDANGWPQTGRNKAIKIMRSCFAFHLCGDQHLSTILQYGIDDWRDANWAFCVPSIANLWPRWWEPKTEGLNPEPGAQDNTGDFFDGFGNRQTIYAHTNPYETGREPAELHDRMPGFGIVRFNKPNRSITMECWPRMVDPTDPNSEQYPGWPRTIKQLENYSRKAGGYLPTIHINKPNQVIKIILGNSQEIQYSIRISGNSFTPPVFAQGLYTVIVGEGKNIEKVTGLKPTSSPGEEKLQITL